MHVPSPEQEERQDGHDGQDEQLSTPTTSKTLVATFFACIGASVITLPADILKTKWQTRALAAWDPHATTSTAAYLTGSSVSYSTSINVQKQLRIISPFIRLMSNEIATTVLSTSFESSSSTAEHASTQTQIFAGAIAGISQAMVICPMEAYRAHRLAQIEMQQFLEGSIWYRMKSYMTATVDPQERLFRAYRGIGIHATREVLFNVTFFPLFYGLQHYFASASASASEQSTSRCADDDQQREPAKAGLIRSRLLPVLGSGIISGMICSTMATPLDVVMMYYTHSREQWNFWSGKRMVAPPLAVIFRGVSLQALIFGPVFGIVACIYELT